MSQVEINERVNNIIKSYIPAGVKIVPFLMDLLNISRESAYRRLRNEISYTVQEVVVLVSKLNMPPQEIFGGDKGQDKTYFTLGSFEEESPSENYVQMMKSKIKALQDMSNGRSIRATYVGNRISDGLLLHYKMLSKLRYIKWVHQTHKLAINSKYSDIVVPPQVLDVHKEYLESSKKVSHYTAIFDFNIVQAVINTIKFYYRRNLITDDELLEMKNELHEVLDGLEQISRTGKNAYGLDNILYLSYLQVESNIILFESESGISVHLLSSGKDTIVTNDVKFCEDQKLWIDSLLKFSVLITRSNEILQAELFTRFRKTIDHQLTLPLSSGNFSM